MTTVRSLSDRLGWLESQRPGKAGACVIIYPPGLSDAEKERFIGRQLASWPGRPKAVVHMPDNLRGPASPPESR